jgi:RNA polymerase sigma-70 factor (ECF subfamily)
MQAAPAAGMEQELARLHKTSFGWALACCGRDPSTAEDVLQDVYFKVLDGRARFDQRSSLKTWLFGVIRMTAREHRRWGVLRLLRGSREGDADATEIADSRRAPDSEAAAHQRAEQLSRALARIAERQREVLHLVFYEDLTIAEAAQIMGVAVGTARQHYERGKHALTAILEQEGTR